MAELIDRTILAERLFASQIAELVSKVNHASEYHFDSALLEDALMSLPRLKITVDGASKIFGFVRLVR